MEGGLVSILQLTSLPVVVGAAVFLTWAAKRALASVPIANRIPVFVYTAIIAAALTYIANRITGTLAGNTGVLIADAIINGVLASGIREWVQTSSRPLAESGTAVKAREEQRGSYVNRPPALLLPLLLAGSMVAAQACSGAIRPPVITPDDQAQVRQLATKAFAGIEVGAVIVRDGMLMVNELQKAGVVSFELRETIAAAVRMFSSEAQNVVKEIATATRTVTVEGLMQRAFGAFIILADLLDRQTDSRIQTAGRFIRTAARALQLLIASTEPLLPIGMFAIPDGRESIQSVFAGIDEASAQSASMGGAR